MKQARGFIDGAGITIIAVILLNYGIDIPSPEYTIIPTRNVSAKGHWSSEGAPVGAE